MIDYPYLSICPICDVGALRPYVVKDGPVVLMCNEDGSVWLSPADVPLRRFVIPEGPDWVVNDEIRLDEAGHWASFDDVSRMTDWNVADFRHGS